MGVIDMSKFLKQIVYYLIIGIIYYPLCLSMMKDTGSAMFTLLILVPVLVFVLSAIFGRQNGFRWYFSLIVGLMWVPHIFIFNDSMMIYCFIFMIVSYLGQGIGLMPRHFG